MGGSCPEKTGLTMDISDCSGCLLCHPHCFGISSSSHTHSPHSVGSKTYYRQTMTDKDNKLVDMYDLLQPTKCLCLVVLRGTSVFTGTIIVVKAVPDNPCAEKFAYCDNVSGKNAAL